VGVVELCTSGSDQESEQFDSLVLGGRRIFKQKISPQLC